ncbi:29262_t:CDS:2, partial [Gigaspora margarita]
MNTKQFKEFIEIMSRKSSPKENNHSKLKVSLELKTKILSNVEANNWNRDCRLQIALGYLKEVAADWYKESKNEVEKNKSFYHLRVDQFVPLEKQYHWQLELNSLTQQKHKRVNTYTTKFKRLLNWVRERSGDTFDEFEYEEDNETEEVEGYFVEWSLAEENPALYLTNIKEIPIKDDDSEVIKTIEDQIVALVDNNKLTIEQQQQAQEFLLAKRDMFAKDL